MHCQCFSDGPTSTKFFSTNISAGSICVSLSAISLNESCRGLLPGNMKCFSSGGCGHHPHMERLWVFVPLCWDLEIYPLIALQSDTQTSVNTGDKARSHTCRVWWLIKPSKCLELQLDYKTIRKTRNQSQSLYFCTILYIFYFYNR